MDMYSFLRANGPLLAIISILVSITAIIIIVIRYLRASPSGRKAIITAIAIPFVLLSMSTFAACNSVDNSGSMGMPTPTHTPVPTVPSEPSSSSSPQPVIADAVYASPGDNLQQKASNLSAGKTLVLRDGFYANQGLIVEHIHGTETEPITIMAEHDGKAIIDGGGPSAQTVWIENSSYIIVQGIVAQHGQEPVVVYGPADHIILRRVTAHDAAPGNYHVFDIEFNASNVLVEDCAGWGRGCGACACSRQIGAAASWPDRPGGQWRKANTSRRLRWSSLRYRQCWDWHDREVRPNATATPGPVAGCGECQ